MTSEPQYSEIDPSYQKWRREALRKGLFFDAVSQYYVDDLEEYGYSYRVNSKNEHTSVITTPNWMSPKMTTTAINTDPTPIPDESDMDALSEFVRPMAFNDGVSTGAINVNRYIHDGTVCGIPTLSFSNSGFTVRPMSFFTVATNVAQLRETLLRSLYRNGISLTETPPFPDGVLTGTPRDQIAPSVTALANHSPPMSVGGSAAVIVNTGDDYKLMLSTRSDSTTGMAGSLELVPAGYLEPSEATGSGRFTQHIIREFTEEVFGHPETEEPLRTPQANKIRALLRQNSATIEPTIASVYLSKLHLDVSALLCIKDPMFYDEWLSNRDLGGWESDGINFVSLSDEAQLDDLLSESPVKQTHMPALVEALLKLNATHTDYRLPIGLTRINP
jgi:hypothetical protein